MALTPRAAASAPQPDAENSSGSGSASTITDSRYSTVSSGRALIEVRSSSARRPRKAARTLAFRNISAAPGVFCLDHLEDDACDYIGRRQSLSSAAMLHSPTNTARRSMRDSQRAAAISLSSWIPGLAPASQDRRLDHESSTRPTTLRTCSDSTSRFRRRVSEPAARHTTDPPVVGDRVSASGGCRQAWRRSTVKSCPAAWFRSRR